MVKNLLIFPYFLEIFEKWVQIVDIFGQPVPNFGSGGLFLAQAFQMALLLAKNAFKNQILLVVLIHFFGDAEFYT